MPSFNKVLLMGHLTRDPQTRQTASQTVVVEFGLASNRKYKGANGEEKEDVVFVDVTAFGRTGEVIAQHFTKGKAIFIEGRLRYDTWEDKNGGGKRSKLSVIADSFQFVGGRDEQPAADGGNSRQPAATSRGPAPSRPPQRPQRQPAQQPFGEEQQFKGDDIPF